MLCTQSLLWYTINKVSKDTIMKFAELVEAPPQSIPSLDRGEIGKSIQYCLQHVNNAKEVSKRSSTVTLYKIDNGSTGYYFVYDTKKTGNERIQYFVKYSAIDFNQSVVPRKAIRQVLVWRNPKNLTIVDVAKNLFWDELWPMYKCLASDSQQTGDGQRFWSSAVGSALQKGLTVRIVNTNDNKFNDVTTAEEFDDLIPGTWGTTSWFQRMIVIIFE